jgi:hypothetical protein
VLFKFPTLEAKNWQKMEAGRSELMRFEARQRGRDFLLGAIEASLIAANILAEFVTSLARRGLGFVLPWLLVGFVLLGITGLIGWMLFLLFSLPFLKRR